MVLRVFMRSDWHLTVYYCLSWGIRRAKVVRQCAEADVSGEEIHSGKPAEPGHSHITFFFCTDGKIMRAVFSRSVVVISCNAPYYSNVSQYVNCLHVGLSGLHCCQMCGCKYVKTQSCFETWPRKLHPTCPNAPGHSAGLNYANAHPSCEVDLCI